MNPVLQLLNEHRSYRDYSDKPVSDADLDAIIEATHRAPTSINDQGISLVVIRDEEKRKKLAEITGGQAWVAKAPVFVCIVMDFSKTQTAINAAGEAQVIHESLEGFTVGATDAGITLATLSTAARASGLGTVMIGAVRRDPQAIIDLLGLPPLTFPVLGCCIGHFESEPAIKPRMAMHTYRHDETWQNTVDENAVAEYDATIVQHWENIGRDDGLPWSQGISRYYSRVYFPETYNVAVKQGFRFDK